MAPRGAAKDSTCTQLAEMAANAEREDGWELSPPSMRTGVVVSSGIAALIGIYAVIVFPDPTSRALDSAAWWAVNSLTTFTDGVASGDVPVWQVGGMAAAAFVLMTRAREVQQVRGAGVQNSVEALLPASRTTTHNPTTQQPNNPTTQTTHNPRFAAEPRSW
mmetsp:Transcript_15160/g.39943  ORF Transcript_15160/g.39943 Transcript_15160/m.39943 type:complete len:162 (-) Transcript_15160:1057-1542(-)